MQCKKSKKCSKIKWWGTLKEHKSPQKLLPMAKVGKQDPEELEQRS